jgi:hypothetical protein
VRTTVSSVKHVTGALPHTLMRVNACYTPLNHCEPLLTNVRSGSQLPPRKGCDGTSLRALTRRSGELRLRSTCRAGRGSAQTRACASVPSVIQESARDPLALAGRHNAERDQLSAGQQRCAPTLTKAAPFPRMSTR